MKKVTPSVGTVKICQISCKLKICTASIGLIFKIKSYKFYTFAPLSELSAIL
jgi:hypothetical protein